MGKFLRWAKILACLTYLSFLKQFYFLEPDKRMTSFAVCLKKYHNSNNSTSYIHFKQQVGWHW